MSGSERVDRAADLIERLLTDPKLRARFRTDAAAVAREFDLPDVALELAAAGKAVHTLEARESKSSLAGVVAAAAAEGMAVAEFAHLVRIGVSGEAARAASEALSRTGLPALRGGLAGTPGGAAAAGLPADPVAGAAPGTPPGASAAAPIDPSAERPGSVPAAAPPGGVSDAGVAEASAAPSGASAAPPAGGSAAAADAADAAGGAGGGAAKLILDSSRLELPEAARQDLLSPDADPRLIGVLGNLSEKHEIGLSVVKTGHDQYTSNGSVSNHFVGRAFDIATVDGQPVNASNVAARDVVSELTELPANLRPTEVGSPWPISAPGFFSDAAHQDHLHVGFDTDAPGDFRLEPPAHEHAEPRAAAASASPPEADSVVVPAAGPRERVDSLQVLQAVERRAPAAASADVDLAGATGDYPGDDAPKRELARWMARTAQDAGLPPELPVMASLVESGLANLNSGDRDSVGFFQMRTGIWNQGEYAGYAERPNLQLKWFIDHAVAVKRERLAADRSFGRDPATFGEWIADVERPAEQYRGRYQLRLEEARSLLRGAGGQAATPVEAGSVGSAEAQVAPPEAEQSAPSDTLQFEVAPVADDPVKSLEFLKAVDPAASSASDVAAAATAPGGGASEMVRWAASRVGTQEGSAAQQRWASTLGLSPSLPWCSIFVAVKLRALGVPLPDNPAYSGAWLNWDGGRTVPLSGIRPGDLVIFDWGDGGITDHVALYVGDDHVIGGNQSDAVTKVPLNRGAVVGVVRPNYPG